MGIPHLAASDAHQCIRRTNLGEKLHARLSIASARFDVLADTHEFARLRNCPTPPWWRLRKLAHSLGSTKGQTDGIPLDLRGRNHRWCCAGILRAVRLLPRVSRSQSRSCPASGPLSPSRAGTVMPFFSKVT